MITSITFYLPNGEEEYYMVGLNKCTHILKSGDFEDGIAIVKEGENGEIVYKGISFVAKREF